MKAEMALTCKAIYYYSVTGNTKAIIEESDVVGFDVYNLYNMLPEDIYFERYATILIGTSTLGNGMPPNYFRSIHSNLKNISGARIGLFGSGNSTYTHFCGALDILENLLKVQNKIVFSLKFESYPTELAKREFQRLIHMLKENKMKLIKFYKDGCAPCQSLSTYLESNNIQYTDINAFKNPQDAIKYQVMSLPTLILVDEEGNEVQRSTGFRPVEVQDLISKLN